MAMGVSMSLPPLQVRVVAACRRAGSPVPVPAHRGECKHLEELAHLGGRQELLHGRRRAHVFGGRRRSHGRKALENAAGQQEGSLRRKARDGQPGPHPGLGDRREVDVGGEVGQSRPEERIGVCAMPVVSHQRAGRTLRMVVLAAREAVVDRDDRPLSRAPAEILDQRLRGRVDLARVVDAGGKARLAELAQRARPERPVLERQARSGPHDTALEPAAAAARQHVRRYGVEHLVHHDDAVPACRQRIEPLDARDERRDLASERRLLPLAQVRRNLQDRVTARHRRRRVEAAHQVRGEPARPGAELDHVAAIAQKMGGDLDRERGAEERRELRGGDEVAGGTELARPRNVVAESRRIEYEAQVRLERNPATRGIDLERQRRGHGRAVGTCRGVGRGREAAGTSIRSWNARGTGRAVLVYESPPSIRRGSRSSPSLAPERLTCRARSSSSPAEPSA